MLTKAIDKGHIPSLSEANYIGYDNKEILNMVKQSKNPIFKHRFGLVILFDSDQKNNSEGIRLIKEAAEDDFLPAVSLMGTISYFYDKEEGLTWSLKAADRRDPSAQSMLGLHYLMSENYEEALTWFSKSAEQNNESGKLGVLFMLCHELVSDQDREAVLNIVDHFAPILDNRTYINPHFSPIKEGLINCLDKK